MQPEAIQPARGNVRSRVAHLGRHHARQLQARHAVSDGRPEVHRVPVPDRQSWMWVAEPRFIHTSAASRTNSPRDQPRRDAADVFGPLADLHADQVGAERDRDRQQRGGQNVRAGSSGSPIACSAALM